MAFDDAEHEGKPNGPVQLASELLLGWAAVALTMTKPTGHRPVVVHAHTVPPNFIPEFFVE